ncbi:hypothetical protein MOQ_008133 [Trypanosoma cruzi marinkellei]|uniref:Uncharacterized protein n=1 Tax=Trypanosoma cruzi marinkellei TaxID=85056 RepID=K2N0P9_TRYCR|nr:hypothetical protein MOQ_008133 [Trypanosoma cruzi marinkellei]
MSISPLSDVSRYGHRPPCSTSPARTATEEPAPRYSLEKATAGIRVLGLLSTATRWSFGMILHRDGAQTTKSEKEQEINSRHPDAPSSSCSPLHATTLSWNTVALLAKHVYLFDVVWSPTSYASFYHSVAPPSDLSLETFLPTPSSSASLSAITAWERLLCAVFFSTSVEQMVLLRHAVSWEEKCRFEDVLAVVRHCTRVLVDGFFRWVPPSSGVRLLLSCHGNSSSDIHWGGSVGEIKVGLLDVESVGLVQRHLGSLRRCWLSTDGEEEMRTGVVVAAHVDNPREDLHRTVRAFLRQGSHLRRWATDSTGSAYYDTNNNNNKKNGIPLNFSNTQRLLHAMAVVAHIESYLESAMPSCDRSTLYHHNEDVNGGGYRIGGASILPFTPAQRDHLVEMLALLMHPCKENFSSEGRRIATHWLWANLGAETNASLFSGPSGLLFHDFLASLAHWLVLQVVPALMMLVSAASCSGHVDTSSPPDRALRLGFHCTEESVVDVADMSHAPIGTSSSSSSAAAAADFASRRNVLLEITVSDWLRWLRQNHARNGDGNKDGGRDTTCRLQFFSSLSSTGARLLDVFDSLELFSSNSTRSPTGSGIWPVLSNGAFERNGAWVVAHWAVGSSYAEVSWINSKCTSRTSQTAVAAWEPLEIFTLGEFIARYRFSVDATRVATRLTYHLNRHQTVPAGDMWRPLPPLFHISVENFNTFKPIIQAKLICSAAIVDYTAYVSAKEEKEEAGGVWQKNTIRRVGVDLVRDNPVSAREAPSVIIREDSGLVKVYDSGALEQLEEARLRGWVQLHECGTFILQAFLRACWSVRWNLVPLRRRAHRQAIVPVQAALRVRGAALRAGRQARRLLEQRQRWLEERRRQNVMREQLVSRMELQAEGQGNGIDDGKDGVNSLSHTPRTSTSWPAKPLNELIGERASCVPDPALGVSNRLDGCIKDVLGCPSQGETNAESDGDNGCDAASVVFAMERKGRGVVQHAEARIRRQLFISLEEKLRERYFLQEYRDRRVVVQQQIKERQEALVKEQRRNWKKNNKKRQMMTQQRQQHSVRRAVKEAPHRAVFSFSSTSVATRNKCGDVPPPADAKTNDEGETSDVVIVIDMQGEDGDEEEKVEIPLQDSHVVEKCLPREVKKATESRNSHVCASLRSLRCGAAEISQASCLTPRTALWRQEHEDRTFIELSQSYRWHLLRQNCVLGEIVLAEMLCRRIIFLAGALERQELLARWRTIILPYCLITEALRADILAALVILQDAPPRYGSAATRMTPGIRVRHVNTTPTVGIRPQQQPRRRTGGLSSSWQKRKKEAVLDGNDENGTSRKRFAETKENAEAQREFLCKPKFHLLASHFSNPCLSARVDVATDRRAPAHFKKEKGPSERRRVVTWVDPPLSSPPPSGSLK